ncbi:MAG: VWA domain-containing protein [Candidatus Hydrogenedentes bacterium]|nr:VWA domain-containing protein [Candidatus Hydrogenedentota bacterium]
MNRVTRFLFIASMGVISVNAAAQDVPWAKYDSIKDGIGKEILILYYKQPNAVSATWRIENKSDLTLYDVAIKKKTYTLVNGATRTGPAEAFIRSTLKPGEASNTSWDSFGKASHFKDVTVEPPTVTFRLSRDSRTIAWDQILSPSAGKNAKPTSTNPESMTKQPDQQSSPTKGGQTEEGVKKSSKETVTKTKSQGAPDQVESKMSKSGTVSTSPKAADGRIADLIGFDSPKVGTSTGKTGGSQPESGANKNASYQTSLLLVIDVSGSMQGEKLAAAKRSATAALDRVGLGSTEVAVLTFTGECSSPTIATVGFSTNKAALTQFIGGMRADGGTPLGSALSIAANFMQKNASSKPNARAIILLADGDDTCGNVAQVLAELKQKGLAFRHETVGLGISPGSAAAGDLRRIANETGGQYHYAENHSQLADVFGAAVDAIGIGNLFGLIK